MAAAASVPSLPREKLAFGPYAKEMAAEESRIRALKAVPEKKIDQWHVAEVILLVIAVAATLFLVLSGINFGMTQRLFLPVGALGGIAVATAGCYAAALQMRFCTISKLKADVQAAENQLKNYKKESVPIDERMAAHLTKQSHEVRNAVLAQCSPAQKKELLAKAGKPAGDVSPNSAGSVSPTSLSDRLLFICQAAKTEEDLEHVLNTHEDLNEVRLVVEDLRIRTKLPACQFIQKASEARLSALALHPEIMAELINGDAASSPEMRVDAIGKILSHMPANKVPLFARDIRDKFSVTYLNAPERGASELSAIAHYPEAMANYLFHSRAAADLKIKVIAKLLMQMNEKDRTSFLNTLPPALLTLSILGELPQDGNRVLVKQIIASLINKLRGNNCFSQFIIDEPDASLPLLLRHLDSIVDFAQNDKSPKRSQALTRLWMAANPLNLRSALLQALLAVEPLAGDSPLVPVTFFADVKPDDAMMDQVVRGINHVTNKTPFHHFVNADQRLPAELDSLARHPARMAALIKGEAAPAEREVRAQAIAKLIVKMNQAEITAFIDSLKDDELLFDAIALIDSAPPANSAALGFIRTQMARTPIDQLLILGNRKMGRPNAAEKARLIAFLRPMIVGLKNNQPDPMLPKNEKPRKIGDLRKRWGEMNDFNRNHCSPKIKEETRLHAHWFNTVYANQARVIAPYLEAVLARGPQADEMATLMAEFPQALALIHDDKVQKRMELPYAGQILPHVADRAAFDDVVFALPFLRQK